MNCMNNFYKSLIIVLLAVSSLHAQTDKQVYPKVKREKLLNRASEILAKDYQSRLATINEIRNPFYIEKKVQTDVTAPSTTTEASAPSIVTNIRMSNEDALNAIAGSLRPTGVIKSRDQWILNLPRGRTLRIGDEVKVTIGEQTYIATLTELTNNTFTLTIENTTRTYKFGSSSSLDAKIQRSSSSN